MFKKISRTETLFNTEIHKMPTISIFECVCVGTKYLPFLSFTNLMAYFQEFTCTFSHVLVSAEGRQDSMANDTIEQTQVK